MRALVVAMGVLWASAAAAEPLAWRAPAGCPEAAVVSAQVEAALGRPLGPDTELALEAAPAAAGWVIRIRVEPGAGAAAGAREITAASCAEAVRAAALVAALLLDPGDAAAPEPPAESPPEPVAAAASALAAVAELSLGPRPPPANVLDEPPPPAEGEAAVPLELGAAAFVAGAVGLQPELGPGFGVAGLARRGAWEGRLALSYWPGQTVAQGDDSGRGARVDRMGATALFCRLAAGDHLRACLGLDGAMLRANDFGTVRPRDNRGVWFAGVARVAGALDLNSGAALVLAADALAPVLKPRFYFPEDQFEPLYTPASWAARLLVSGEWRWR